jgi:hypothetical protein
MLPRFSLRDADRGYYWTPMRSITKISVLTADRVGAVADLG